MSSPKKDQRSLHASGTNRKHHKSVSTLLLLRSTARLYNLDIMEKLIRCRGCPRCGSSKSISVGDGFHWGTRTACRECQFNYAPPPSLLAAISATLVGACFMTDAGFLVPAAKNDATATMLLAGVAAAGLTLLLFGVLCIRRYARTPKGPLTQTNAFPVLPPDPR